MTFRRKNRQNEVEIQLEDVELVMGRDYARLHIFLNSVFCTQCSNQTSIEDYRIFLDDTHDLIFEGHCVACKNGVSRYIETGESFSTAGVAWHIREVKLRYSYV